MFRTRNMTIRIQMIIVYKLIIFSICQNSHSSYVSELTHIDHIDYRPIKSPPKSYTMCPTKTQGRSFFGLNFIFLLHWVFIMFIDIFVSLLL